MTKKLSPEVRNLASEWGKLGGKTTLRRHGKAHLKAAGKKGAEKRWGRKRKTAVITKQS